MRGAVELDRSSKPRSYTGIAKFMHWLVGLLIIANFALGLVMVDIQGISPTKLRYFNWHKWTGVTIFALACLRLLWRWTHRPPALPASMPQWERSAADLSHAALYLLMFAVPLSGYFYSLSAGYPIVYLGLIPLPVLMDPNPALKESLEQLHHWLAWAFAAVFAVHVLAALKHHFINRDAVLVRMLPGKRSM